MTESHCTAFASPLVSADFFTDGRLLNADMHESSVRCERSRTRSTWISTPGGMCSSFSDASRRCFRSAASLRTISSFGRFFTR